MWEDWGKLTVAKGFIKLPKVEKSPNLVTLLSFTCSQAHKYTSSKMSN